MHTQITATHRPKPYPTFRRRCIVALHPHSNLCHRKEIKSDSDVPLLIVQSRHIPHLSSPYALFHSFSLTPSVKYHEKGVPLVSPTYPNLSSELGQTGLSGATPHQGGGDGESFDAVLRILQRNVIYCNATQRCLGYTDQV